MTLKRVLQIDMHPTKFSTKFVSSVHVSDQPGSSVVGAGAPEVVCAFEGPARFLMRCRADGRVKESRFCMTPYHKRLSNGSD